MDSDFLRKHGKTWELVNQKLDAHYRKVYYRTICIDKEIPIDSCQNYFI